MSAPPSESPAMVTAIRVSAAVRDRLWKLAAEQRAETGRAVSMGDVIGQLLDERDGEGQ